MAEGYGERASKPVRRLSRRRFLYGAAATLGGVAASSCAPLQGLVGGTPTIKFWNLFGGGDGIRLETMESKFRHERSNPGLQSVTLSWGSPYYTKLAMAAVGGSPPDVAIMHLSRKGAFAPAGLLEPLDPDLLSRHGIGSDKFLPRIWESAKYDGKVYAVPLDTHPFVMYYNTDICKKAGLLGSDGKLKTLEGPDEVIQAFEAAKKVTGAYGLAFYPNDSAGPWRLFYTLYSQMGGKVLSPDAKEVVLDDSQARRVLDFMAKLTLDTGVASKDSNYPDSVALFQSGKAGFYWNGEWEVTTFEAAKMPFDMVPFPNVFGGNQVQADRHSFVIPRGVDAARKEAALEFVNSMLESSLTWAEGGHIPAYQPVATSAAYKKLKPQSNYSGVADDVVLDPVAWFSGSGSQMEIQASAAFQAVMAGEITPEQGVSQFRDGLRTLIEAPRPF
jgi:multiple sugar transport system substrate-binding protein